MTPDTDTEGFATEPAPTPAYRLGAYDAATMDEAHGRVSGPHRLPDTLCPHRRTYVVAGRQFCHACGRKVGEEKE